MKIISWNVNGLRAIVKKGNFLPIFETYKPDIFCLQETKAEPSQLPEDVLKRPGYSSYFSYSKTKKGYSGVGIYSKLEPKIKYGIDEPGNDDEGRVIVAEYPDFVLLNVYFPNGGGGPVRLEYKLKFYDDFLVYIDNFRKKKKKIIFCGDINTAHEEIDLARPKENETHTGFLPEERAWLDEVVAHGYIDIYRHFYPNKTDAYTYWDMFTRARERNVGWRIDYFFISPDLLPRVKKTEILADYYGSDHCPILLELS